VEASYLPSPHVVIGLNSRLENYSSWSGALDLIKSIGVPAFFTDQCWIAHHTSGDSESFSFACEKCHAV
jgi:hypothetical protein